MSSVEILCEGDSVQELLVLIGGTAITLIRGPEDAEDVESPSHRVDDQEHYNNIGKQQKKQ